MLFILIQGRKEFEDNLDIFEDLDRLKLLTQVRAEETAHAWIEVLFHARFPMLV